MPNLPARFLYLYFFLQEAFGWDLFKQMHLKYQAIPESQWASTDAEKQSLWVKLTCHQTGFNLYPFYQKWGWLLVDADAKKTCASQKQWTKDPTANV